MKRKNKIKAEDHDKLYSGKIAIVTIVIFVIAGAILGGIIGYNITKPIPYTNDEISACTEIARNIYENGTKAVSDKIIKGNYDILITSDSEGMIVLFENVEKETIRFEFYEDQLPKYTIIEIGIMEYVYNILFLAILGGVLTFALFDIICSVLKFLIRLLMKIIKAILKLENYFKKVR